MKIVFIVVGAFVGAMLAAASDAVLGLAVGGMLGYVVARMNSIEASISHIAKRLNSRTVDTTTPEVRTPVPRPADESPPVQPTPDTRPAVPAPERAAAAVAPPIAQRRSPPSQRPVADVALGPNLADKVIEAGKRWLTTGNVPVKLGVLVSFFGVAFLLKYAVDQRILVIPLELRYFAVAAVAAGLFVLGWKLRHKNRVYALSVQGGAIGILYLTIFAAFRLHPILPSWFAFLLLVALTAATGFLAVLQNAHALAVLGTIGGFLAPLLVSTGSGNYIGLFSYYLILNGAVLGIAWRRSWRSLNLIGFGFTFGVGTMWGYEYYQPEYFRTTEPFLIAFFLFYHAISILFAFRQPTRLRGIVDGTLVFGTPGVAFALQAQLLEGDQTALAISAGVVAVFYAVTAVWLHRSFGKQMHLLVQSFIALAVAFGTLAIPLALDDRWTALAWALEGAALVWVGVKQQRLLSKIAGTALLFAAGGTYIREGWDRNIGMLILNANVIIGWLIALLSIHSARRFATDPEKRSWQTIVSVSLLIWGVCWWVAVGGYEIDDRVGSSNEVHVFTAFLALSAAALAFAARHYSWVAARRTTLAYLPFLPLMSIAYLLEYKHMFAEAGFLIWIIAIAAHFLVLWLYDQNESKVLAVWHYAGAAFVAAILSYEVFWWLDDANVPEVWTGSMGLLVLCGVAAAILAARDAVDWPLRQQRTAYLFAAVSLTGVQLLLTGAAGIDDPGDPAPLAYVPILNPFDLLTIAGLIVALWWIRIVQEGEKLLSGDEGNVLLAVWGVAAFFLTTIAVVRGVYHFSDLNWNDRVLMRSVSVQSALSIYWAILGLSGMIMGARRANRWIWMVGTGLMVFVVIKLFMIDLGNTGTVARIISFLGVGAMLLVVGYYAPAPPRRAKIEAE